LGYPTAGEADETSAIINEKYGVFVHAYPNGCSVDITPVGVSKSQGIKKLLELMEWQDAEVYAIGDESNDLPMLEAFDGVSLNTA
jgi:hydroxymethylpyrimidine pyrophosphatase-like HAD family hydrolase